jgi:hypothetical protein
MERFKSILSSGPAPHESITQRVQQDYVGGFIPHGGSNPDEGHVPMDTEPGPSDAMSPEAFWGQQTGGQYAGGEAFA